MQQVIGKILFSLTALPRAVWYALIHPWVWPYYLILLAINFLSFAFAVLIVFTAGNSLIQTLLFNISAGQPNSIVTAIIGLLTFLLSLILAILLFGFISSIVSAPIYAAFGDALRKKSGFEPAVKLSWIKLTLGELGFEFKKIFLVVILLILSLPLNLIPVIGQGLYSVFGLIQVITLTGIDLLHPYFSTTADTFRSQLNYVLRHPAELWPLLLVAGSLGVIPVINLFTIPLAIVAVHLVYERQLNK